jgi:hypothetical protein
MRLIAQWPRPPKIRQGWWRGALYLGYHWNTKLENQPTGMYRFLPKNTAFLHLKCWNRTAGEYRATYSPCGQIIRKSIRGLGPYPNRGLKVVTRFNKVVFRCYQNVTARSEKWLQISQANPNGLLTDRNLTAYFWWKNRLSQFIDLKSPPGWFDSGPRNRSFCPPEPMFLSFFQAWSRRWCCPIDKGREIFYKYAKIRMAALFGGLWTL